MMADLNQALSIAGTQASNKGFLVALVPDQCVFCRDDTMEAACTGWRHAGIADAS